MSPLLFAAVVALVLVAAAAAWPAMYALWSRAVPRARELNLWRLAARRGVARSGMGDEPDLSRAVYRCIGCYEAERCDELLDAGRTREVEAFCPNRGYLARLSERHRRS